MFLAFGTIAGDTVLLTDLWRGFLQQLMTTGLATTKDKNSTRITDSPFTLELSDQRAQASSTPFYSGSRPRNGFLSPNLGDSFAKFSEDESEDDRPRKRRPHPNIIAGVKSAILEQMAEDNHGQIISLQIAADKSSKAFNDLTAIQNKSNRAQDQIENQYCETKLKITKD